MKKNSLEILLDTISENTFADEQESVKNLLSYTERFQQKSDEIFSRAERYVTGIREKASTSGVEGFLSQFKLGTHEGITIMCLAEALLRIPDSDTADQLIHDKLKGAEWEKYLGKSNSVFVNASTWGLMLSGGIVGMGEDDAGVKSTVGRLVSKLGEPIVREALKKAMEILGTQFVLGCNIESALKKAKNFEKQGYLFSYDMLGEGARSEAQAKKFLKSYKDAITYIGKEANKSGLKTTHNYIKPKQDLFQRPGISVKLSAIHPRYEFTQQNRVMDELVPRLKEIIKHAMMNGLAVSIDSEEANRLDISLLVFKAIFEDKDFHDYDGIGFVLQAYQKRAIYVIDFLLELAKKHDRRIPIRLVKGAYWDAEIKRAQELGLENYPVFTRKSHTDVSYLACAAKILDEQKYFYPQFATHNALTVASILEIAEKKEFEFQRLYGMGDNFYNEMVKKRPCRVYAPVGRYDELLPYLIRRILENGANTSFVNLVVDESEPIGKLLKSPMKKAIKNEGKPNPETPLPEEIFKTIRKNSLGFDVAYAKHNKIVSDSLSEFSNKSWHSAPIINCADISGKKSVVYSPNDGKQIGTCVFANEKNIDDAIISAKKSFQDWNLLGVEKRADILDKTADLIENNRAEIISLCIAEAGKTIPDAISEVREAADFCRYYANQARDEFVIKKLPSITGENNSLQFSGKGIFACISPWNFPVAIFAGQIAAALVSGNAVIAKPAEQSPLSAYLITRIFYEAGVPKDVLNFIPGDGEIGAAMVSDENVSGVVFTGSTETARKINIALAARNAPIATLIAETGGQNAMIVDSSALPEQVIDDIMKGSFNSAGQRCSALRVAYLQEDVADKIIELLSGAMQEIKIGNPLEIDTDIGPVIDLEAKKNLSAYITKMEKQAKTIAKVKLPSNLPEGNFIAPHVFEIKSISELEREVFGPILHIIRFKHNELDRVLDEINATGYGLTFGIHSRIEHKVEYIKKRIHAGNIYVNRSQIGAVVGVHPFGGVGLSGTGPKAGGPNYLMRFVDEKVVSTNTSAIGGNIALLS